MLSGQYTYSRREVSVAESGNAKRLQISRNNLYYSPGFDDFSIANNAPPNVPAHSECSHRADEIEPWLEDVCFQDVAPSTI